MKPNSTLRHYLLAAGSSLLAVSSASAQTDYYWDRNGGTAGTGGTGNWNVTDNFWRSGSSTGTLGNWSNGSNDAIFGGTAGTVTINSASVTARSLVFDTAGYTIARTSPHTLTINGATADHGFFVNQNATISAVIAGSDGLIKRGAAALTLSNTSNSFSGTIQVTEGRLDASAGNGVLGNTANGIQVSSGAQLYLAGAINTSTRAITINGNGLVAGDGITAFGALRLDSSSTVGGTVTLAGDSRIGGLAASFAPHLNPVNTISGKITGAFGVDFFGAAFDSSASAVTHVISNTANDYTGNTTITNGALSSSAFTSRTNLRLGASNVIPNGAGKGNVVFALSGTNNASTSALNLNGFNETINGLTVNPGTFTARITNGSTTVASVLTVGDNDTTSAFSGIIEDSHATNNLGITKIGTGTLTLSGSSNTYRGATNVDAGTLAVTGTGSINSSSAINVAAGGTLRYNSSTALTVAPTLAGDTISNRAVLGGTGIVNVSVTLDNVGDVLSPGNSPGIQNYIVAQTWSSFSYDWEVNNFTGTTAGADFDQITGTGFSLAGGPGSYILNVLGLTAGDVAGLTPNFSEINRTWTILSGSGASTFSAANWSINTAGFSSPDAGTWSLAQAGNDLVLSYTAIPEPGAALLGSLGMLALLRRRRA